MAIDRELRQGAGELLLLTFRKSSSIWPPRSGVECPAVCDLHIPDGPERRGEVASPPDEKERPWGLRQRLRPLPYCAG
jgi:hypothetical protein